MRKVPCLKKYRVQKSFQSYDKIVKRKKFNESACCWGI